MSFHAIYLKLRKKYSWHLVSIVSSPELANQDMKKFLKQAKKEGNTEAEVGMQLFDSTHIIPEIVKDIKQDKPLFN